MKTYGYLTSLALAVAGVTFVGCDRNETAVDDTTPQTETGRSVENATDSAIRGTENLARDAGEGMQDLGDRARDAGESLRDGARQTGERARDAITNTGNELDRAGERTGEAARDAGREMDRDLNESRQDVTVRPRTDGVVPPDQAQARDDSEGIRDVLAQVPEAALTEDGFDDLVERLVDADRNRIGQFIKDRDDFAELNRKAQQIRQMFQAKYGAEFDIADEGRVLGDAFARITQSEITEAQAAAARQDGDANRDDAGRNTATVQIQQSHGLPALTVNMLHEAPGVWKIDLPDQVNGQQLYDNANKALDRLAANQAQWPESAVDAQRYITHHLLLAIHGQEVK